MAYYKKNNGKNYDKELLDLAEKSVSGKGDGRISLEDAKEILDAVKDGNKYTDVEKATMEYIRENYKFTASADKWFRTEIRKWAAKKKQVSKKKVDIKSKRVTKIESTKPRKVTTSTQPASLVSQKEKHDSEKNLDVIPLLPLNPPRIEEETKEHELTYPKIPAVETNTMDPDKRNIFIILGIIIVIFILLILFIFRPSCSASQKPLAKLPQEDGSPIKKETTQSPNPVQKLSNEEIEKLRYSFKIATVELTEETKSSLQVLAATLKENKELKLKIIGHSCDIGTEEKNKSYSLKRAAEVQKFLIGLGIEKERLLIEGKGETEPEVVGDSEEARAKNRRVQFVIIR